MNKCVLILDCGATNVKACLIDESGRISGIGSMPNQSAPDPYFKEGLIWDIGSIWNKLIDCTRKACSEAGDIEIAAITATSFGVDGTLITNDGTLCYPVISWQCDRTRGTEQNLDRYFNRDWLYYQTGLQSYHFNTINKLIWLRENRGSVFNEKAQFLLMPSLILRFLCGALITDMTMAGTTMLTSLTERQFQKEIFEKIGLQTTLFPPPTEPGTVVGELTSKAAALLGIKSGIPVIATGHDTQFALIGSGGKINEPVLSSGTWEILMTRSETTTLNLPDRNAGVTVELDAVPGIADMGLQWVASGVIEWLGRMFYHDSGNDRYPIMMEEALKVPAGSNGLQVTPEIYAGGYSGKPGAIEGFTHETSRGHIFRATLEALCYYTRHAMERLESAGRFSSNRLLCVGGGSKNSLWNQVRADVLGIPVHVPEVSEATALGAAMVALTGLGVFGDLEEASVMLNYNKKEFLPGPDHEIYRELYEAYLPITPEPKKIL